jgi:hypothetical protein
MSPGTGGILLFRVRERDLCCSRCRASAELQASVAHPGSRTGGDAGGVVCAGRPRKPTLQWKVARHPAGHGPVLAGTSLHNRPIAPVLKRKARPCLFRGCGPRRGRVRRVGYHGGCENVRRMPFPRPPILASEGCRPEFAAGGGRVRPDARPGCVAASDFRVSRQSDPAQSLRACAPGRRTSGHPATREQAERLMDN